MDTPHTWSLHFSSCGRGWRCPQYLWRSIRAIVLAGRICTDLDINWSIFLWDQGYVWDCWVLWSYVSVLPKHGDKAINLKRTTCSCLFPRTTLFPYIVITLMTLRVYRQTCITSKIGSQCKNQCRIDFRLNMAQKRAFMFRKQWLSAGLITILSHRIYTTQQFTSYTRIHYEVGIKNYG